MTLEDKRYFVIYGAMRTGSNLLQTVLNQASDIHCFGELFNPSFINGHGKKTLGTWTIERRDSDPFGFMTELMADNPLQTIGFRLFDNHNSEMRDITAADPNCRKIILRRNPKDCYVSWKMARNTDIWLIRNNNNLKKSQIRFDKNEYEVFANKMNDYYDKVTERVKQNSGKIFTIYYYQTKDLSVINELISFIGSNIQLPYVEEKIKKQNVWSDREIIENYDEYEAYFANHIR